MYSVLVNNALVSESDESDESDGAREQRLVDFDIDVVIGNAVVDGCIGPVLAG